MKCKKCNEDLVPYAEFSSMEKYYGNWEGKIFRVIDSKDTGESEIIRKTLFCQKCGRSYNDRYELEW